MKASTYFCAASLRCADLSLANFGSGADLRDSTDLTGAILDGTRGSVRIDESTKGLGELECHNDIINEAFKASSTLTEQGTVRLKDVWADLKKIKLRSLSVVLTFNENPEGMEMTSRRVFKFRRPSSRARHSIRIGKVKYDEETGLPCGLDWFQPHPFTNDERQHFG